MEVGIGHHGEPGVEVMAIRPARAMADLMLDHILPDLPFARGDDLAVLISGLGATPIMELYILYDRISEVLTDKGMKIVQPFVANYFTSLEMMGRRPRRQESGGHRQASGIAMWISRHRTTPVCR